MPPVSNNADKIRIGVSFVMNMGPPRRRRWDTLVICIRGYNLFSAKSQLSSRGLFARMAAKADNTGTVTRMQWLLGKTISPDEVGLKILRSIVL
jgi:hypothetical protein